MIEDDVYVEKNGLQASFECIAGDYMRSNRSVHAICIYFLLNFMSSYL